jgi:hypothetical protein
MTRKQRHPNAVPTGIEKLSPWPHRRRGTGKAMNKHNADMTILLIA